MGGFEELVERRIREAMARGDFEDLPGAGKPLPADDMDPMVPKELRLAYRILKNAGYVPEEVRLRREIADVGDLLALARTPAERASAGRRLQALMMRLPEGRREHLASEGHYLDALASRLERRRETPLPEPAENYAGRPAEG